MCEYGTKDGPRPPTTPPCPPQPPTSGPHPGS